MPEESQRILIVDDDENIRHALRGILEDEEMWENWGPFIVAEAATGDEALAILASPKSELPNLMVLDHYLPDMEGTDILKQMLDRNIDVPVILVTGKGRASGAILATQLGADAYLSKPFEDLDEVVSAVDKALRRYKQRYEGGAEMPEIDPAEKIVGPGAEMLKIFQQIGLVARTNQTILITGEHGTGKSLLAETIHQASDRRRGPFISFSCAGWPETLLEDALFGHEKGAYTGAVQQVIGKFEQANKGTIFLDEIGEMSPTTQVKLLTVLQNRQLERLGGTTPIKIDVRIITATNKNLTLEVHEKRFRPDLYYRLNVFSIHMPALRERKHDIPALVSHFLKKYPLSPTLPPARVSQEALNRLEKHYWPGNVRELENVIQRAVIHSRGELISPEHILFTEELEPLLIDVDHRIKHGATMSILLYEVQHAAIRAALRQHEENIIQAAEALGIGLDAFNALRTELGL